RGAQQAGPVARPALAGARRVDDLGALVGPGHGLSARKPPWPARPGDDRPRGRLPAPHRRTPLRPQGRRRGHLFGRAGDARAADPMRSDLPAAGGRLMSKGRPLEIAIVGMGCRFPGAGDLSTYWENILAGKDCIREVPPDRWDPEVFHDPASTAND